MTFQRYVLSLLLAAIGFPTLAAEARVDLSGIDDAVVSPRFIVKYRDGSSKKTQPATRQRALDAALARVQPQMGVRTTRGNAPLTLRNVRGTARGRHIVKASGKLDRAQAEALMRSIAADPDVEYVGVDRMMQPYALPNDPFLASHQMWHYGNSPGGARATSAWETGATGAGIVVAVIDTGVVTHADLSANLLPGYDFITDAFISRRATDDRAPGGWDLGNWSAPGDCGPNSNGSLSNWHGTHVSGTVAAVTNNAKGGAGVAPLAKVVPIRVLGRCGGYTSDIDDAIVWAAGGAIEGMPANPNPAEVINLSLGGIHACEESTQAAVNRAVALGATVVVAAGNSNINASESSPANCANVITVASNGYTGTRASYSNYGTAVALSAPGGGATEGNPNGYVWSTHNSGTESPVASPEGDRITGMVGTSMAAPHVAGIVALVQGVAPMPLTPSQVLGVLIASARPFPVKPESSKPIGVGIVDAVGATEMARDFGKPIEATALTSNVVSSLPTLVAGTSAMYSIDVPQDGSTLEVLSFGGKGVVAIYVQFEAAPYSGRNLAASARPGTNQTVQIKPTRAGRYYIRVVANQDASGMQLRARVL